MPNISKKARLPIRTGLQSELSPILSGSDLKNFVKRLDCQLCQVWHYSEEEYTANGRKLIYNLHINGPFLVQTYAPETLAVLNSDELGKGTAMDQKKKDYLRRRSEFSRLVGSELDNIQFDTGDVKQTARRCPKCKQWNVITVSRQTRSADEGMTNYGYCQNQKCGHIFHITS